MSQDESNELVNLVLEEIINRPNFYYDMAQDLLSVSDFEEFGLAVGGEILDQEFKSLAQTLLNTKDIKAL